MENPQHFVDKYVNRVSTLYKNAQLAYWDASVSGEKEDFQKYEKLKKEWAKIHNNKEEFEFIKSCLSKEIKPSDLKRQLEVLYNEYLSAQGDHDLLNEIITKESEVENKFNLFRANHKGETLTDNQIKNILKSEKNSEELRSVWEASKKQGEIVKEDLLNVIKLRNKLAKSLGFPNFHSFSLRAAEQDEEELSNLLKELEEKTDAPFKKLKSEIDEFISKRYSISKEELKPWHYQDLFFQEGPEIYDLDLDKIYENSDILETAKKFYSSIDLPVEDILERSSLYEQPGKSQHAFALDVDKEGDVKILQNVINNEKWFSTTLHELGHAVYWKFMDPKLPWILRDAAHIFTTEAIAMLFGRLSKNIHMIKLSSPETDIETLSKKIKSQLRLTQLVFSRWVLVMFNFERELYKDPDQDLNKLWWDLVKKYQMINFERDKPDWASKVHFVMAPVYYHNYLLGELTASQLHNQIAKKILNEESLKDINYFGKKEIGTYLKENIFKQGKKFHWSILIEKATGEKLNNKYFIEEFVKEY